MRVTKALVGSVILLAGALFTQSSMAQSLGSIHYAPPVVAPVPALSGATLVLLALVLAAVGIRLLTARNRGVGPLLVAATLTAALASGIGGVKLVSDAFAPPTQTLVMLEDDGGELSLVNTGPGEVVNQTARVQRIVAMTLNAPNCSFTPIDNGGNGGETLVNGGSFVGTCIVGLELPPGSACEFTVYCDPI
jgi:hypothetical protein